MPIGDWLGEPRDRRIAVAVAAAAKKQRRHASMVILHGLEIGEWLAAIVPVRGLKSKILTLIVKKWTIFGSRFLVQ